MPEQSKYSAPQQADWTGGKQTRQKYSFDFRIGSESGWQAAEIYFKSKN